MSKLEQLIVSASQLEPDAVDVLCLIAERLLVGQKHYGRLDIAKDGRDWLREALEEDADGIVYRAIATIQQMRRQVR